MENPVVYDKPFKTYDELIELMKERNIIIDRPSVAKAVLSSHSYYTIINGYKNTFLSVPGTDSFKDGTHFDDLYSIHLIDIRLNNIILKNILLIERFLKTRISYVVSRKYGVYTDLTDMSNLNSSDYLFRDNYSNRKHSGRNSTLKRLKSSIVSDHISESVSHYINDKNHVPPWILVNGISLGLTIRWYEILANVDKTEVCNQFVGVPSLSVNERKEFFTVALNLLHEYRNRIAHGSRTFNTNRLPFLPKSSLLALSKGSLSGMEYNSGHGKNDLFSIILLCFILIDDPYVLKQFFEDLQYILFPYKKNNVTLNGISIFSILGLPEDLFERLKVFI